MSSGKFLDIEASAATALTKRVLDGIEEANGLDSGSMERKMELEDVFMMKTSLLCRLRMQREDAAHTDLMGRCHAVLSKTKELGGLMEQVRRVFTFNPALANDACKYFQVASLSINSQARVLNCLIARDGNMLAESGALDSSVLSSSSLAQISARVPSRFELRQASLRAAPSLPSSQSVTFDSSISAGFNTSNQRVSSSVTPSAAFSPQSHAHSESFLTRSSDSSHCRPDALQITGASIIRAASASPVLPQLAAQLILCFWLLRNSQPKLF